MLPVRDVVEHGDLSGAAEHPEDSIDLSGEDGTFRKLLTT